MIPVVCSRNLKRGSEGGLSFRYVESGEATRTETVISAVNIKKVTVEKGFPQ